MATVIIEGGLVRDVVGLENYEVLDLDVLEDGFTDREELDDLLELVQSLPEDYADREGLIERVTERIPPSRQDRLRELLGKYFAPDVDAEELLDDPEQYALIEGYPVSTHFSISTHGTKEGAGYYHAGQEDPGWFVEKLVDLDTGAEYVGAVSVNWKPR